MGDGQGMIWDGVVGIANLADREGDLGLCGIDSESGYAGLCESGGEMVNGARKGENGRMGEGGLVWVRIRS